MIIKEKNELHSDEQAPFTKVVPSWCSVEFNPYWL